MTSTTNAARRRKPSLHPCEQLPYLRIARQPWRVLGHRVGSPVGTFLLPTGADRYGARSVLLAGAAVLAVGGPVSQFLAPETTDRGQVRPRRAAAPGPDGPAGAAADAAPRIPAPTAVSG